MNLQNTRSRLKRFYAKEGISVDNFHCPNKAACLSIENRKLFFGSEAHLSCRYGVPFRIVVVSLDRGTNSENIDDRTRSIESLPPQGLNQHMRGTAELLRAVIHPEEIEHTIWEHFAMTNSAKCCYADHGMESLKKDTYFKYCAPFARQELEILSPDLIITEGSNAKVNLSAYSAFLLDENQKEKLISCLEETHLTHAELSRAISKYLRIIRINEKNTVHLHSIHPSAWQGGSWRKYQKVLEPLCNMARTLVELYAT